MESKWYKNVIVYSVDVKSFYDGNGDGIGDFQGLICKLDYLSYLGITCVWLLPIYPSPWRDNGYDVTDYYNVDSRLGTLSDFKNFIREAAERGISVIMDLVVNHTSNEHPWFQAARNDPNSLFRDYYVWADIPPPSDPDDAPAFPDSEHGVWTFDEVARSYYYHKFYHFQPDLRTSNPKVQEEIHKVIDFWLAMGVAGFRLDAVSIMINKKGLENTTPRNAQDIYLEMRKLTSRTREERVLMGEVDVEGYKLIDYFADGGGLHLVFNFLLNTYLVGSIAQMKAETLIRGWRELPVIPEYGTWLNFLRNMDELNISQLRLKERNLVFENLAPDPDMQIYGRGIRRRLAPMLKGNIRRIEMCLSLLFSLPGTPMIVYGDEIGLGDNMKAWERESVRSPMQWTAGTNGGFSSAAKEKLLRPMVEEENYHYSKLNVESQQGDPNSLLTNMKQFIYARKKHKEIGHGRLGWVSASHPSVLAHISHWKNDMLLAVHNLSDETLDVTLDLRTIYAKKLTNILGDLQMLQQHDGNYKVKLQGFDYGWFTVHYEKEV